MKIKKTTWVLILILIVAFVLRIINISFPFFTSDEARIAYRGYTLSHFGTDELGRPFPLIFNSLIDYQLPLTSYITTFGIGLFGKSDLGARIMFIIIGTLIVYLSYCLAYQISNNQKIGWVTALIIAFSPSMIFLSKTPNDAIILTLLFVYLFQILVFSKTKIILPITIFLLISLTTKQAWSILPVFTLFTVFGFSRELVLRKKIMTIAPSLIISIIAVGLFLNIPQGERSLQENNFSIFQSITIENGINRLRGQGSESGWPSSISKLLFNKSAYLLTGFLHWLSNLQPSLYFAQMDAKGLLNFSQSGVFNKIFIIPLFLGIIYLLKQEDKKQKLIIIYLLILTFPAIFVYPSYSSQLLVLTTPFLAFIIATGMVRLKTIFFIGTILFMVLEIMLTLFALDLEQRYTNNIRPSWSENIMQNINKISQGKKVIVSDNLVEDFVPIFEWNTSMSKIAMFSELTYPYKFRQTKLGNIILHGTDKNSNICERKDKMDLFLSKRDLSLIEDEADLINIKAYQDNLNKEKVYYLTSKLCLDL